MQEWMRDNKMSDLVESVQRTSRAQRERRNQLERKLEDVVAVIRLVHAYPSCQ